MQKLKRIQIVNQESIFNLKFGWGIKAENGGWSIGLDNANETMFFSDSEIVIVK